MKAIVFCEGIDTYDGAFMKNLSVFEEGNFQITMCGCL